MLTNQIDEKISKKEFKPNHVKRIEDLIEDAEIEAEIEIERNIRRKNAKIVLISLVGLILLFTFYVAIQDEPYFFGSESDTQVAELMEGEEGPKPLPFPLLPQQSLNSGKNVDSASSSFRSERIMPPSIPNSNTKENPGSPDNTINKPVKTAKTSENDTLAGDIEKATEKVAAILSPKTSSIKSALDPAKMISNSLKPEKNFKSAKPIIKTPSNTFSKIGKYFIQLGAFANKANSNRLSEKLISKGYSPFIEVSTRNISQHTVFIGGFLNRDETRSLLTSLKDKGHKPALEKSADGTYSIILGRTSTRSQAEKIQNKLIEDGILTNLGQTSSQRKIYTVKVGGFESKKTARNEQKKLRRFGFKQSIITIKPKKA